jgi:hypothetical protein
LSYFHPALPRRPVDRNSAPDSMAHFIPTAFDSGVAALIGQPAADVHRPITCSEPLVEATMLESPHGVAVVLVNWSGQPIKNLQVTLHVPTPGKTVELATGGQVNHALDGGRRVCTFDLNVADALVLR